MQDWQWLPCSLNIMELIPDGIRMTLVCPYWVVSEFHEAMLDKHDIARCNQGRAIYTKEMMSAKITLRAAYYAAG